MPDGTTNPGTSDQQVSAEVTMGQTLETVEGMVNALPFVNVDLTHTAGGGGGDGHFRLESVAELDALIAQWKEVYRKITESGDKLEAALQAVEPPARDEMSRREATATMESLREAAIHNRQMSDYTVSYITKLTNARNHYENTETQNTSAVKASDGA